MTYYGRVPEKAASLYQNYLAESGGDVLLFHLFSFCI